MEESLVLTFVPQAALYCRKELGLRLVANLLLALASLHPAAVKHLARSVPLLFVHYHSVYQTLSPFFPGTTAPQYSSPLTGWLWQVSATDRSHQAPHLVYS